MKVGFGNGDLEPSPPEQRPSGGRDNNYDKNRQNEPEMRMGTGSYANLPAGVIQRNFARSHNYRSQMLNRPEYGLEENSGIFENGN